MTGRPAPSERELFERAVALPPHERAAFLDEACGDDAQLRHDVESLVQAHDMTGSFMQQPAVDLPGGAGAADQPAMREAPGAVIGPYKLLEQIGEGGFGVVFLAEQTRPVERRVALKVIKPGMDTRQVIARFEAERQALAMMDHPNIARVFDAGATAAGRPYFVMELVKGAPITKYCDERRLRLRERLELLLPACHAVQHAHQKGVIHRDIKPTSILVAEFDDRAVPKVIDFGVAKATGQKLTDRTMFTEFGQIIGTFEYMSPEQARLNQFDVDTRTDIYSLGVLLYELLTGQTPFDSQRLHRAAFDEVLRIIREEEPPKPSTRLSSSDSLPAIAANRHTEPARLTRDICGELDWIVMKSLEKDRNRRYESALSLAQDIERFLTDQAVQAGPPSLGYKFRKFVKRNKRATATATLLGMAMLGAITATAAVLGWALRDRQAREALIDQHVVQALEAAEPALDKGDLTTASTFLQQAEGIMATNRPRIEVQKRLRADQVRLSRLWNEYMIANEFNPYQNSEFFGEFAQAEPKFRETVRKLPENAMAHAFLARHLAYQDKLAEAEQFARKAVRLNPQEAWAHHCLGLVLVKQAKFDEAAEQFRTDLKFQRDWPEFPSGKFDERVTFHRQHEQRHSDRGQSQLELAWALRRAGREAEANEAFQLARQDKDFSSPTYAGDYFAARGRYFEAMTHYLEATRANPDDFTVALRTACLLLKAGERQDYEAVCRQMLDRSSQAAEAASGHRICFACLTSPQVVGDLAVLTRLSDADESSPPMLVFRSRALAAYRSGDWDGALRWSRSSRKLAKESDFKPCEMQNLVLEAMALHQLNRRDEARTAYDESVAIARERYPTAPTYIGTGYYEMWSDWLLYEPLRHEAEALMGLGPKDAAAERLSDESASSGGASTPTP